MARSLALALALALGAAPAVALQPPASEAELTSAATAIARVEVVSVVCTGPSQDEGDWEVTRYRATLRRIETLKGEVPERFELAFAEIDSGDGVAHSITFEPGWRGRVFLVGQAPSFALAEWNGAISDPDAKPGELPSCGGGCGACALEPATADASPIALAAAAFVVCAPPAAWPSTRARVSRGGVDATILNVGLELAMAFGEHWLSPTQARLHERFSELSSEQLDAYDAACREAMRFGHEQARLALREHPHSQARAYELFRDRVRARFAWIDDAKLSHLFSQGCYYAWKDGELT